jgi:hypothetical protein
MAMEIASVYLKKGPNESFHESFPAGKKARSSPSSSRNSWRPPSPIVDEPTTAAPVFVET